MLIISKYSPSDKSPQLSDSIDMLAFDIRLTKDKVPVLLSDANLWRTHRLPYYINRIRFDEVRQRTESSETPIISLENALSHHSGNILLHFDLKSKGTAERILPLLKKYLKKEADWDLFIFASTHSSELNYIRRQSKHANLSLIHWSNPLSFLVYNRKLDLTAVGFHRLHINSFSVAAAKRLGLFTYVYTVNRPAAAERLQNMGIDALITDFPEKISKKLELVSKKVKKK